MYSFEISILPPVTYFFQQPENPVCTVRATGDQPNIQILEPLGYFLIQTTTATKNNGNHPHCFGNLQYASDASQTWFRDFYLATYSFRNEHNAQRRLTT